MQAKLMTLPKHARISINQKQGGFSETSSAFSNAVGRGLIIIADNGYMT